ncbi:JAB1/Mov34/MPN/PAD-1 ubiquitin protease [Nitzschia inconspicua]|uniref:Eukaryotic translation initiation factor 3 subunit F n=1 Tax=Nitzschia inconspicua TaxID=303405 RepID=A0A9K3PSL1_9STRA|nr:JAB1/Mov34/MPN/PAD-1 ubiquitin protease [Nitzschia inconspicua]
MATITSTTSVSSPALLLENSAPVSSVGGNNDAVLQVIVHPLVLLHVLDHHTRRSDGSGRVIGTLLGRRDGKKVEITNCFAVPHAERGEEVAIGKDFNKQMLGLHLRANRKETVVGWYASAAQGEEGEDSPGLIIETSSLIHDFYSGETEDGDPIHLIVDTRLLEDAITVRAYRCTTLTVQGEALANMFQELSVTLKNSEPETIALHRMVADSSANKNTNNNNTSESDEEPLLVSMEKLYSLLEAASDYVDAVVEGKTPPDAEVGRKISDSLDAVPRIRPDVFDKLFNDSLQDLLMVTYLSNITRTQLSIAEKLNASLGV